MLWLPSLTMPSSMDHDSSRESWKYRSAASTWWPITVPRTRVRRDSSRPEGASSASRARARGLAALFMRPSFLQHAMRERRKRAARLFLSLRLEPRPDHAASPGQARDHAAPVVDDHRVAVRL